MHEWHQFAIDKIKWDSIREKDTPVIVGQSMFWSEAQQSAATIFTGSLAKMFTHILYWNVPAELILQRRNDDLRYKHSQFSIDHLRKWQSAEQDHLTKLCPIHGILFSYIKSPEHVPSLLREFVSHNESLNMSKAHAYLDGIIGASQNLQTMLVIAADNMLQGPHPGTFTVQQSLTTHDLATFVAMNNNLFDHRWPSTYLKVRQSVLMHEMAASNDDAFDAGCEYTASRTAIRPDILTMLRSISNHDHVGVMLITSGSNRIWGKVLRQHGLSDTVTVIGSGRFIDGHVITPEVLYSLMQRLGSLYGLFVCYMGSNIAMMKKADQAVILASEHTQVLPELRTALIDAIDHQGLQANQVHYPRDKPPLLEAALAPIIQLDNDSFLGSLASQTPPETGLRLVQGASRKKNNLTMSQRVVTQNYTQPTGDSADWHLALEHLSDLLGVEQYSIPAANPLVPRTHGLRIQGQICTTIIARAAPGDPLAQGIASFLDKAMFMHAAEPGHITAGHLSGQGTVILVYSLQDTAAVIARFVRHIRHLHARIRIVVIGPTLLGGFMDLIHAVADEIGFSLIAL
ncbi:hypothetical protein PG993_011211 [Apiospora rasikravindrae]|uniref:Uncharacterized protein n=1 Tax=Apiospora rasikravindrae TaxID=990691 RepID=A0ABR1SDM3_9PEZI